MTCSRCSQKPNHSTGWWAGLLLVGTGLELMALRRGAHEHTLSHFTRRTFRTQHRAGRMVFGAAWSLMSWWFINHICNSPHNRRTCAILETGGGDT